LRWWLHLHLHLHLQKQQQQQQQVQQLEQKLEQDQELSRRSARVTFVLAKVTKTAPARHEPVR